MIEKSKGHMHFDFGADVEWFARAGELYRAPLDRPVMTDGYRCGRWECSLAHAMHFESLFPWLHCQPEILDAMQDGII